MSYMVNLNKSKFFLFLLSIIILSSCVNGENNLKINKYNLLILEKFIIPKDFDFDGSISQWPQFKKAAISLTFDDGTYDQYALAYKKLEQMKLKGTFYVVPKLIESGFWNDHGTVRKMMNWDQLNQIAFSGHEVGSHTMNHIDMSQSQVNLELELKGSRDFIESKIPHTKVETFCWPHWRESDLALEKAALYYISGRSGNGLIKYYLERKGGIPSDPPKQMFTINSFGFMNNHNEKEWKDLMDRVYENKSWFVSSYHGINDDKISPTSLGWSALDLEDFIETIEYPLEKDFHFGTFAEISKYIYQRDSSTLHLKNGKYYMELTISDQMNDLVYDQKLSVSFNKPELWEKIEILDEEGNRIYHYIENQKVYLHLYPNGQMLIIKPLLTDLK